MKEMFLKMVYRLLGFYIIAVLKLWFSHWRRSVILPILNSPIFCFFLGHSRNGRPSFVQRLLQNSVVPGLRAPAFMLPLFWRTLRVCITYRCNLSCKACYARGLKAEIGKTDMDFEDFARLLEYCNKKGWNRIRFLGGEPTIHPRFAEMVELCRRNGMDVSMATNNLFPEAAASVMDPRWIRDMAINYSASFSMSAEDNARFRKNLDLLKRTGVNYLFSYILDANATDAQLKTFYSDIKKYQPVYTRVSLELPAFSDHGSKFVPAETRKFLFSRIMEILETSLKAYVPFYVYRPVPICLFSEEERERLQKYSKFIFFTRCPLSCKSGPGASVVTVNPDLSTFPCASLFFKGPNILEQDTRAAISVACSQDVGRVLAKPLAEACVGCGYHHRFLEEIARKDVPPLFKFAEKDVCQGGCVNFRCHDAETPYKCRQE